MSPGFDPVPELSRLVGTYASAVDARDLEALRRLFLADATLTVRRGGAEPQEFRGAEGLAGVIEALGPFEHTLHEVSSLAFEVGPGGDEASGESVCVAHHVRRAGDGERGAGGERDGEPREVSDLVLHGRYADVFRRDDDGAWRIATRELRVLWTEKRPVRLA